MRVKRIEKDKYTVYIYNNLYNICFVSSDLYYKDEQVKAYIQYKDRTIYIDSRISIESEEHCLIHELTHAVIYETQIMPISQYNEEHLCELMALYGKFIITLSNKIISLRKRYDN